jgi:Zn-dependent alcohol dehydrogenase
MPGVVRAHPPLANVIGEHNFLGKEITMLMVDFNVDADGSYEAVSAALNTISRYGNILLAGAIYGTGQQIDVIIEGSLTGSDYTSVDGTVTGTLEVCLEEDILNLATIDGVNFAAGTPAVTTKTTFKLA